jgi:hypothetical protein
MKLVIKDIEKSYGEKQGLKKVSFTIVTIEIDKLKYVPSTSVRRSTTYTEIKKATTSYDNARR